MIRVLCTKRRLWSSDTCCDDQEDIVQLVVKALELQNHKVTGLTSVLDLELVAHALTWFTGYHDAWCWRSPVLSWDSWSGGFSYTLLQPKRRGRSLSRLDYERWLYLSHLGLRTSSAWLLLTWDVEHRERHHKLSRDFQFDLSAQELYLEIGCCDLTKSVRYLSILAENRTVFSKNTRICMAIRIKVRQQWLNI